MITTEQCSICSQLNNKTRVAVTDFRPHHTCNIIEAFRPGIKVEKVEKVISLGPYGHRIYITL